MSYLDKFKSEFERGYKEQKAIQDAGKANYRKIGVIVFFVVVLPVTIANYIAYQSTGRFITILLAVNIAIPVLALWMIITGKDPLRKTKK